MRARVYLPEAVADARFTLSAAQSRYLIKVLRLRNGAECALFDGKGNCYHARIVNDDKAAAVLHTGAALPRSPADAGIAVHIGQVVCGSAKMDWALEKMTELGVTAVVPLISENSPHSATAVGARQLQRWQRLMAAACAQCGRNTLPALLPAQAAMQWRPALHWRRILLTPRATKSLADVVHSTAAATDVTPLILAVGGESGFSDKEEAALLNAGFQAAQLGTRILRSETAALAALAYLHLSETEQRKN